jgi:hypothetical protein
MQLLMSPFFSTRLTWPSIVLAKKPSTREEWKGCEEVVCDVWHTMRSVTLRFLWQDRNRCLFDGRQPTPITPTMQVIFSTACAHFRHYLRRLATTEDQNTLQRILAVMKRHQGFSAFTTDHSFVLRIRTRED